MLYLCGALQQRRRLLPLGELSHPWRPTEPPEPQTRPAGWILRQAPGQGGAVLMGVGPLANPGHAGRGAVPEAAAIQREGRRGKTEKGDKRKRSG